MKIKVNKVGHAEKEGGANPFRLMLPLLATAAFLFGGCASGRNTYPTYGLPPSTPADSVEFKGGTEYNDRYVENKTESRPDTAGVQVQKPNTYTPKIMSHIISLSDFYIIPNDPNVVGVYLKIGGKTYKLAGKADRLVVKGDTLYGEKNGERVFKEKLGIGEKPQIIICRKQNFTVNVSGASNLSLRDVTKIEHSGGVIKVYAYEEDNDGKSKEVVVLQVEVVDEGKVVVKKRKDAPREIKPNLFIMEKRLTTVYEGKGWVIFDPRGKPNFKIEISPTKVPGALRPGALGDIFVLYPCGLGTPLGTHPTPGPIFLLGFDNPWQLYLQKVFTDSPGLLSIFPGPEPRDLKSYADRYRNIRGVIPNPNARMSFDFGGSTYIISPWFLPSSGVTTFGIAHGDTLGGLLKLFIGTGIYGSGEYVGAGASIKFYEGIGKGVVVPLTSDTVTIYDYVMPGIDAGGQLRIGEKHGPKVILGITARDVLCHSSGSTYYITGGSESREPYALKPPVSVDLVLLYTYPRVLSMWAYSTLQFERKPFFTIDPWREGKQELILTGASRPVGVGIAFLTPWSNVPLGSVIIEGEYDILTRLWYAGLGLSLNIGYLGVGGVGGRATDYSKGRVGIHFSKGPTLDF